MKAKIEPSIIIHPKEIALHPLNSNQHSPSHIKELAEGLIEFSQYTNIDIWTCPEDIETKTADGKPVTLKKGITYALKGNGLVQALWSLGWEDVEVKDMSHLSFDKSISLLEYDNASPLGSKIDPAQMKANLDRVRGLYKDNKRLRSVLDRARRQAGVEDGNGDGASAPGPQTDKAQELQEIWQVERGQLWQIGDHRLLCGDCRNPDDLARLTGGEKVNGIFTSPPYAMQRKAQYGGVEVDKYVDWWEAVQEGARSVLAEDGSFFVNIKPHCENGQRVLYVFDLVLAMVRWWGWRFVDELCWVRPGVPGKWNNRHRNSFEECYHFSTKKNIKFYPQNNGYHSNSIMLPSKIAGADNDANNSTHWNRNRNTQSGIALPDNVLNIANSDTGNNQAATFPIKLPTFFIRAYSDPNDLWLDPFCGSGTTGIAAHQEGRRSLGIEILPKYCAVILQRFRDAGLSPQLTE